MRFGGIRKMLQVVIYGLIALIVLVALLRLTPIWDGILSAKPAEIVDFATLEPPPKPNWFLLCEDNVCTAATPKATPPIFEVSAEELKGRMEALLLEMANTNVRLERGNDLDVLIRTPIMRWPDIISIQIVPLDEGKSTLRIYSRSIYGHSDLGANKARVMGWLARLQS